MKKVFVTCLMALGMLLPVSETTAKESAAKSIINILIDDEVLRASSQEQDGPIVKIVLLNDMRQIVQTEMCGYGYYCETYLRDLPAGLYIARVETTKTSYATVITVE
jgi:hypothetical protein